MRQNMYPKPGRKDMDAFSNFSGGMNSVTSNENLRDSELAMLVNADIHNRGSAQKRYGMSEHLAPVGSGLVQGYFRYWKAGVLHSEIRARGGKLYRGNVELPITGLASFQNTRTIEAVQYNEILYIATGTKLVQYDGTEAKLVDPYKPQPLEALYVGTNALSDNPDNFMQDGVSVFPRLDGVTFDQRYGIVNQSILMTAYVSKPAGMVLEYKFERRFPGKPVGEYLLTQNWSTKKDCLFVTSQEGDYEIHALIRDKADPTYQQEVFDEATQKMVMKTFDKIVSEYYVPKYKVKPTIDPKDAQKSTPTVQTCNRIFLHWDRLYMYGDPTNGNMLYMSHLKSPAYWPTTGNLLFEEGKGEDLTKVVQFRGMLACFTDTSTQALMGTNPLDFKRQKLNMFIGCPYPETVKVMGNYVTFLSREGLHILKSTYGVEDQANVTRIDGQIQNILFDNLGDSMNVCATVVDNQYHLVLPDVGIRLRYYYEQKVWVMDDSAKMDFERLYVFEGRLYGQSISSGAIVYFDPTKMDDLGQPYEFRFETKHHDFTATYNPKKLKQLQLLADKHALDTSVQVYVYADSERIWNVAEDDITSDRSIWQVGKTFYDNGDAEVYKMKMRGKGRTIKMVITQTDSKPFRVYGYGFIFKTKSPK